jgi:hypothetical protein
MDPTQRTHRWLGSQYNRSNRSGLRISNLRRVERRQGAGSLFQEPFRHGLRFFMRRERMLPLPVIESPIAPPAAMLISVSPNNRNTAVPRLQLQPISPTTRKKTSAPSAMTIRFVECKSIISRRRNTSATMHLSYLSSSPLALPGRFVTT